MHARSVLTTRDPRARHPDADERLFFVHVMKTGGTSLLYDLMGRFAPGEVYPDAKLDRVEDAPYDSVPYLLQLDTARRDGIRVFCGHFPFAAVDLLPGRIASLTVLRDPVERTLSYLSMCLDMEPQFADCSLEDVYNDPIQFTFGISNFQTRVFALTADDEPLHVRNPIDIDERRLSLAKRRIERVDVLGIHEQYDDFLDRVVDRFGWERRNVPRRRVGRRPVEAAASLRRRIEADNAADMELYTYAREILRTRRARDR